MHAHPCVLLVDDDPLVLLTATASARAAGLAPVSASDGEEALGLLTAGLSPALVVTDLDMPRLDGVGLLAAVRALHAERGPHTIMFSAEQRPSRNGGADLWLSKNAPAALDTAFREFVAATER